MLQKQDDLKILAVKDYIKNPKPNGYQSLHLLVEVPVFMSEQSVPESMTRELKHAADSAYALDLQMERLHREIKEIKDAQDEKDMDDEFRRIMINNQQFTLPANFIKLLSE